MSPDSLAKYARTATDTHAECERNARAQAMWERYSNGESLRAVGAAFGVRAQTVHAAFRVRGWVRRPLSDAQLLGGNRIAQRQLLATLIRLRTACSSLGIDPDACDRTLEAFDPEEQARVHARAKNDLARLLTRTTPRTPSGRLSRAKGAR